MQMPGRYVFVAGLAIPSPALQCALHAWHELAKRGCAGWAGVPLCGHPSCHSLACR